MGSKLLLSLLCVMLVIILVFNTFGFAYSKNNFMDTMLTVESTIGDFSNTVNGFFNTGLLTSFFELLQTIGNGIVSIEEKFNIIANTSAIVEKTLLFISNFFSEVFIQFDFFGRYGFKILDNDWNREVTLFFSLIHDESFWADYKYRTDFNWNKYEKYRNAYLYGEKNEYYYMIESLLNKNILDYVPNVAQNTLIFDYSINPFASLKYDTCDYWLTTVNLSLPDDYCTFLPKIERLERYYSCKIPVYDSNFTYEYHDRECTLTGIVLKVPNIVPFNGNRQYNFELNNSYWYLNLIFTYVQPNGELADISVDYYSYVSSIDGLFYQNHIQLLEYIPF